MERWRGIMMALLAIAVMSMIAAPARAEDKSPVLAGILSGLVFPGTGQMYAGDVSTGLAFLGGELVLDGVFLSAANRSSSGGGVGGLAIAVLGVRIWDALNAAGKASSHNARGGSSKLAGRILAVLSPDSDSSRFHVGMIARVSGTTGSGLSARSTGSVIPRAVLSYGLHF